MAFSFMLLPSLLSVSCCSQLKLFLKKKGKETFSPDQIRKRGERKEREEIYWALYGSQMKRRERERGFDTIQRMNLVCSGSELFVCVRERERVCMCVFEQKTSVCIFCVNVSSACRVIS